MITVYPITYDKLQLRNAPAEECALHFMLAQIGNDIATLQKQILFCLNEKSGEIELPVGGARTASALMLVGFLAGRLYEAWTLIRKEPHSRAYGKYSAEMTEDGRDALMKIKAYFSGDNLIQRIRLKLAFHTDIEAVQAAYENCDDDQSFTDYISRDVGNTIYHGASLLNALAMARLTGEVGLSAGLNKLMGDIPPVGRLFSKYTQAFMMVFYDRYVALSWEESRKNSITFRAPRLKDVRTPYFCEAPPGDIDRYDLD